MTPIEEIFVSAIRAFTDSELQAYSYHGDGSAVELLQTLGSNAQGIAQYATTHKNWPHLIEETRELTNGWVQPMFAAPYYAMGLKPPPAIITHESRWVSPWREIG